MRKKRILIPALASVAAAFTAMAAGPQLVFEPKEGGSDIHKISEVSRVTFTAGGLEVANVAYQSPVSYPYAELAKVVFDYAGVAGISKLVAIDEPGIKVYPSPAVESISVTGIGDTSCRLSIYATDGKCVDVIDGYTGGSVDISGLAPGVYIVNAGQATAKFFKTGR